MDVGVCPLPSALLSAYYYWQDKTLTCFPRTAIIWTAAQGYLYGIAAPFWYAAGCSIQIALMTVLAIHAKVKVPYV